MLTRRALLKTALSLPPMLLLGAGCSGATSGMKVTLDHGPTAPLGGVMTFRLTATSSWDAPNPTADGTKTTAAEVYFSLMDGLAPVEPLDPQWVPTPLEQHFTLYRRQVTFKAKVPQTFEFQVRLDQLGELRIIGGADVVLQTASAPDSQTLYLLVMPNGTQIQRTPFSPTA